MKIVYGVVDLNKNIFDNFKEGNLELFYKNIYPALILYANRFLSDENALFIEDMVQETIVDVWNTRDSVNNIGQLKSLLYVSLKNKIINIYHKAKARERYITQLEDPIFFRNTILDQEANIMIYKAINDLPDHLKMVFELNFFEEMKLKDIAKQMSVSERTVDNYKKEALIILRKKLDPELYTILTYIFFEKN